VERQLVISKDILIEELLEAVPAAVSYLMQNGIKCIACGEPIWGTLEQAARDKGFSEADIQRFVADLRSLSPRKT
jgi:methionine synthase II (cobalamin-independent)